MRKWQNADKWALEQRYIIATTTTTCPEEPELHPAPQPPAGTPISEEVLGPTTSPGQPSNEALPPNQFTSPPTLQLR